MERAGGFTPQFTCKSCPARSLEVGTFDVVDADDSFDYPQGPQGYRVSSEGTPTCIHPHKIGLPEFRMSPPENETAETAPLLSSEVPAQREDFLEWVVLQIKNAPAGATEHTLDAIHAAASAHYSDEDIVSALRIAFAMLDSDTDEII